MKVKKVLIYAISVLLFICFALFIVVLFQQVNPINPLSENLHFQSNNLNSSHSAEQKTIPNEIRQEALVALSVYPELYNVTIDFEFVENGAPLESTFKISSLFLAKKNRHYIIKILKGNKSDLSPILIENLPFNARVGILTHELAHVAYYEKLNSLQIAKWAIQYATNNEFRIQHEKSTDRAVIMKGLGDYMFAYAFHIRNCDACRPLYNQYGATIVDKYYMTPEEIEAFRKEIHNANLAE